MLRRLRRYSYEQPFVTNSTDLKILLMELEDMGLVETMWSENLSQAILFAWIPCEMCVGGIRLGSDSSGGVVAFDSCPACGRYANDLDAATALTAVTGVVSLTEDDDPLRSFGFDARKVDKVQNYLGHQLDGRTLPDSAA